MNSPTVQLFVLVSFSVLLALGQILFKQAAISSEKLTSVVSVVDLMSQPSFWAALVLYGFATFLWVYILQFVALSRAYPFVALGFVIIPFASKHLFREALSGIYWVGVACIVVGILLTSLQAK